MADLTQGGVFWSFPVGASQEDPIAKTDSCRLDQTNGRTYSKKWKACWLEYGSFSFRLELVGFCCAAGHGTSHSSVTWAPIRCCWQQTTAGHPQKNPRILGANGGSSWNTWIHQRICSTPSKHWTVANRKIYLNGLLHLTPLVLFSSIDSWAWLLSELYCFALYISRFQDKLGPIVPKMVNSAIHQTVIFSNFLNMFSNW